ncbi:acetyl-CoA carboxylase biotin carboxylase subunit [Aquimarina sp. ERC-38]|uniref:acetyl-CoA carboxylase biotin carboxylase subunit n=1 Tax=Aquimarina sp. ERC-38 TaxID=2949996 RepID=UPI0022476E2B|nr:acetyl-CoA carboxylase biotin carboxylase subunit [Aquimarina sp. ERC-38]UZO79926.1 acetyl-CoA carboxylase biotin carboxylase subunit [Aquimarina sp. ERC-38]
MKKILVANRGEIALRILKTCKKMNIATVAVYSEVDRNAPHVLFADEAVCIGAAASNDSYLKGEKIIEVAKDLQVEGIHPGYGFLSENASFAQKVIDSGLIFIGPNPESIRVMGSKLASKETVKAYNIPLVPGTEHAITDIQEAKKIAVEIGYPILIKASAGGGGKGMRMVERDSDFENQMQRAVSEAQSAFGDGAVFIEKYIGSPRHIEIQVLADRQGNTVHLFERECSIQRRHQKVVEEAPSSILSPELRAKMGEAAVKVAKSCSYLGAGTVEFLLDENSNFYFLEMNTRLQVEHPVTELITGTDLVALQIKIARGETLAFTQEDLHINGHALELRVYAEDPTQDFLPSTGLLTTYQPPKGKGIRVDDGYVEGMEVPIYYDPLLSKLVVHAENREAAISLMIEAIEQYQIKGIQNTLEFGKFVCQHEAFTSGNFDTHFVKKYFKPEDIQKEKEAEMKLAAQLALKQYLLEKETLKLPII